MIGDTRLRRLQENLWPDNAFARALTVVIGILLIVGGALFARSLSSFGSRTFTYDARLDLVLGAVFVLVGIRQKVVPLRDPARLKTTWGRIEPDRIALSSWLFGLGFIASGLARTVQFEWLFILAIVLIVGSVIARVAAFDPEPTAR